MHDANTRQHDVPVPQLLQVWTKDMQAYACNVLDNQGGKFNYFHTKYIRAYTQVSE